jgi:hypothetical protein
MAGPVVFQGKVVGEDGVTPVEGVIVSIGQEEEGTIYNSEPTNRDGVFRVDSAEAGRYAVLARKGDVGFLAAEDMELAAGENPPVAIMIRTGNQLAPADTAASELPLWGKIAIGGSIAILMLAIFDQTGDEGNDSITPF